MAPVDGEELRTTPANDIAAEAAVDPEGSKPFLKPCRSLQRASRTYATRLESAHSARRWPRNHVRRPSADIFRRPTVFRKNLGNKLRISNPGYGKGNSFMQVGSSQSSKSTNRQMSPTLSIRSMKLPGDCENVRRLAEFATTR
jgi:hypothetical protein